MDRMKTVMTACGHDCGGRCVLKVHVKGGRIVRMETDDGEEPQLRACLRGRAYRQRVYSPDRLTHPMRRVGERGEGKFERISWHEALDTVARELIRVKNAYGNASILLLAGSGNQAVLHGGGAVEQLLAGFGGCTRHWGAASFEGALFASIATYGTLMTGNAREDLLNSRLILMWGWNPAVTVFDTNTAYELIKAREKGIRIVSVDPRHTDSAAALADQWIPIRPGTDAAMLIAMAYVIIQKGLQDTRFLDSFTVGFDKYRSYVMGDTDGTPKTPAWAAEITGVPEPAIERLAVEYAEAKPAALISGWGPARGSMGEQFTRAAGALAAMTGNVGIPGGFAGGFMRAFRSREMDMPKLAPNPVEENTPMRPNSLYKVRGIAKPSSARIHRLDVYDAILRGKTGGYPADLKLAYITALNVLNSTPDVNKGIEAFKSLEFIIVHESRLTPTARFADILLPVNTFMERDDVIAPWLGSPYYIYMNKAIDPLYESRSDRDICAGLATRLGVTDYRGGHTDAEWLRIVAEGTGDIRDFNSFKESGVVKLETPRPFVAFREQVEDPANHRFATPSGKIEIYCEHLARMSNPRIPAVPQYLPAREGHQDPLAQKYPLQLITTHHKPAVHGSMEKVPWLDEVEPRRVAISPADAARRGIADGDEVLVFNDRGRVLTRARVTDRIMPGVVNIGQGAWFDIDDRGIDRGGCANTLTPGMYSPGGAWSTNTVLVQIEKVTAGT